MTETSSEFSKLELALVEAGGLLRDLPEHDIGDYIQQLKLRSYVLLCHAALEEYLENISLAVLQESLKAFEEDGLIRDSLLSACSYYRISIHDEINHRASGDRIQDILCLLFRRAIADHTQAVVRVHGIKTKDQDSLLLPVGVRLLEFDRLLSQNLNSYGGMRGKLAHCFGMKSILPRSAQEGTVWYLFRLLLPFDNMLCERHRISFSVH